MPLTKKQIEGFKERLIALLDEYSHALKGSSEDVKASDEGKGTSQHQADIATDDFGKTISIEISSKETQIVYQIERALEKIEEGTYGICDLSGEEIPLKRLEAIPYANMTVQAQEKLEKGQV